MSNTLKAAQQAADFFHQKGYVPEGFDERELRDSGLLEKPVIASFEAIVARNGLVAAINAYFGIGRLPETGFYDESYKKALDDPNLCEQAETYIRQRLDMQRANEKKT